MTERQRRRLPIIGYVLLTLGIAAALLLSQSYARDTREAVRETRRLAVTVANQTKQINAARRAGCEDANERWERLAKVLRPFRNNPMQTLQQRKTLEDLLRVTEPRDCSTVQPKKEP